MSLPGSSRRNQAGWWRYCCRACPVFAARRQDRRDRAGRAHPVPHGGSHSCGHAPGHPALRAAAGNLHSDPRAGGVVRARLRVLQPALRQPRLPGLADRGCPGRCGPGHCRAHDYLRPRVRRGRQPRRGMGHHRVYAAALSAHDHAAARRSCECSAWQLALTVVFMLGGIYGLFRAGARLYENAVLHSGARLRLREAWRGEPARP
jgi:hypothetical protein